MHSLILENRERLTVTGVVDVESFNDEMVVADTEMGLLIIRGEDLHINKLSVESSELSIEGYIASLEYSDKDGRFLIGARSLLTSLFSGLILCSSHTILPSD